MTKFIKDVWRKKEVISVLFLDIKSAFPCVVLDWLVHDMRNRGVQDSTQVIALHSNLMAMSQNRYHSPRA